MEEGKREREAIRVTLIGGAVNICLTVAKLLAGIFGNSAALVADGVHSLSDLVTDIAVIIGLRLAGRPSDERHEYGHGKIETLVTGFIGVALFAVGIGLLYDGTSTIYACSDGPLPPIPGYIALAAALVSIVAKEGVGGAITLGGRWVLLDPLAAVIVSVVIVKVAYGIVRKSIDELLDCAIDADLRGTITELVEGLDGVIDVHDMRTRRIGSTVAVELHISVDKGMDLVTAHALTESAEEQIALCCGSDVLVTIHVDPV
jgi:divalent metal cation (Fe/Co/Zn/Cd) transporter